MLISRLCHAAWLVTSFAGEFAKFSCNSSLRSLVKPVTLPVLTVYTDWAVGRNASVRRAVFEDAPECANHMAALCLLNHKMLGNYGNQMLMKILLFN